MLSIIVPTYNSEKFISSCISSIHAQTFTEFEVLFIDGGSHDKTLEIIRSCGIENKTIISEPDKGVYDAMNKGIKHARGQWIHILNSDDMYTNRDTLMNVFSMGKNKKIMCFAIEYAERTIDANRTGRVWIPSVLKKTSFINTWHVPHPGMFVHKSVYHDLGVFNTGIATAADYEFMLRCNKMKPNEIKVFSEKVILMRIGGISDGKVLQKIIDLKSIFKSYRANDVSIFMSILNIIFRYCQKIAQR